MSGTYLGTTSVYNLAFPLTILHHCKGFETDVLSDRHRFQICQIVWKCQKILHDLSIVDVISTHFDISRKVNRII